MAEWISASDMAYKREFARQMRTNAVKNREGNVTVSWELWEQIANLVEGSKEWISVKDRLPYENCKCLIYTDIYFVPDHRDDPNHYKGIEISMYLKEYGFLSANSFYATHWMPLPEPPKED